MAVALTSLQIVLFIVGLALAGDLTKWTALLWIVAGLFCHQGAYLAGVILRITVDERSLTQPGRQVAAAVDEQLLGIDRLADRIASQAPQLRPEAANLSQTVSRLRHTLNDEQELAALAVERRGVGRLD